MEIDEEIAYLKNKRMRYARGETMMSDMAFFESANRIKELEYLKKQRNQKLTLGGTSEAKKHPVHIYFSQWLGNQKSGPSPYANGEPIHVNGGTVKDVRELVHDLLKKELYENTNTGVPKERILRVRVVINPIMQRYGDDAIAAQLVKGEIGANSMSLLRFHFLEWEDEKDTIHQG